MAGDLTLGDGVRITLFNVTDPVTGDYFVQQNGKIQLPFIGLVSVLNRDFQSIQLEIISKYDSIYRDPEITVQPLYKISILGEVRSPGRYYVTGVEQLMDIIVLAGGETEDSNLNNIYLIRDEEKINIDATRIIKEGSKLGDFGLQSGDQIYVPRNWWVWLRNVSVLVSVALAITTITILASK